MARETPSPIARERSNLLSNNGLFHPEGSGLAMWEVFVLLPEVSGVMTEWEFL